MKRLFALLFALALSWPCSAASKVVTVFFASDGGRWTDLIVNAFSKELSKSKKSIEFTNLSVSGNLFADLDRLVQRIIDQKPELIFLPDDMSVINLAPKIRERTSAPIIYVAIYAPKPEIEIVKNQQGILIEPDIAGLLTKVRLVKPVSRIGIVSGPYASKMLTRIENDLKSLGIEVTTKKAQSWEEYQKSIQEFDVTQDALWPLIPFGLKQADGSEISGQEMELLLQYTKVPTLGYGRTPSFKRSFSLDVDPVDLGTRAGELALEML